MKSSHGEVVTRWTRHKSEKTRQWTRYLWRVHRVTSSLAPSEIFREVIPNCWTRTAESTSSVGGQFGCRAPSPAYSRTWWSAYEENKPFREIFTGHTVQTVVLSHCGKKGWAGLDMDRIHPWIGFGLDESRKNGPMSIVQLWARGFCSFKPAVKMDGWLVGYRAYNREV